MVYVFLADGFEEIEALATVDIIRRAGIECKTVGVKGKEVTGAHNISVISDILPKDIENSTATAVVLPGGMPGTVNLDKSDVVRNTVMYAANKGILIAAICAAPSVLGHLGLLKGKNATCYDGFEDELTGAKIQKVPVCRDGNIITAAGAGAAVSFGLEIVKALKGEEESRKIFTAMKC